MDRTPDIDVALEPLASGFAPADRAAWEALAEATLKGAPLASLTSRDPEGMEVRPLYTGADAGRASTAVERFASLHGQGVGRWDVRTIVDHPDPATANADALKDLENGASSLLVRIDPSGVDGVASGSSEHLARVLAGVELDLAPVALDAGWLGPQAGEWLHSVARAAPRAKLALHLDPIGAFAASGGSPGPAAAHVARAAELAARLAPVYTDATLFLASGRAAYEAGGGAGLELGLMAASVVAYVEAMGEAGVEAHEALSRIVLGVSTDGEYFTSLAKHRAARAVWTRLCAAYGVEVPSHVEARAGRRQLSRLDPWVNLLRLTAAGFGAAVGGADAIVLEPFTQPLTQGSGRASAFARRQARNIQLVLMEESHLARVEDPAGGCWFLEDQTDRLARAGWAVLREIARRGGVLAALEDGFIAAEARASREALIAALEGGKAALVGASVYRDRNPSVVETLPVDPEGRGRTGPDPRLPGADGVCPPLTPWRAALAFELADEGAHA